MNAREAREPVRREEGRRGPPSLPRLIRPGPSPGLTVASRSVVVRDAANLTAARNHLVDLSASDVRCLVPPPAGGIQPCGMFGLFRRSEESARGQQAVSTWHKFLSFFSRTSQGTTSPPLAAAPTTDPVLNGSNAATGIRNQPASSNSPRSIAPKPAPEGGQREDRERAAAEKTQCKEAKEAYHHCFDRWYTQSFLKGQLQQPCQAEWEKYQLCVQKRLALLNLDGKLSGVTAGPPSSSSTASSPPTS
eukprot:scaffold2351_cov403-Prasinococcus_capsulatus_cf.AAC.14